MVETIAVIGGGIGGLAVALSLKHTDHKVILIERDPPPPEIAPEDAFEAWARPGVPQFRHAHILLSRLQTLLRDRHPELLEELLATGMELSRLEEVMPAGVVERLRPEPGDEDLRHLWGRRATFEYVLRQHVGRLPNVTFMHGATVVGLVTEAGDGEVRVRGVQLSEAGPHRTLAADVVVDAAGKRSKSAEWLQALGVTITSEGEASGFIYACRHYQLRPGEQAPSRRECGGNLDYLGYSTFFAERGHYAVAFGSPEEEQELVQAITSQAGFETLARRFVPLRRWREASEPRSKVLGAGRFQNRWIRYGVEGETRLCGFFAVGDCHLETNPMYGRGCASAFVQAQVLAEALAATADPLSRARRYNEQVYDKLQPYYEISLATDRIYHTRARRRRGQAIPFGERLINYFYEAAWLPATHSSVLVAREFIKAVQMREVSRPALRLAMSLHLLVSLVKSWLGLGKKLPQLAPPPPRGELIAELKRVEGTDPPPPTG